METMSVWEPIIQVATIIVALIAGVGGTVPLVNWLKSVLNLSGRGAQLLAVGVSILFATATAIAQGFISPDTLTPENYATIILAVLTASQFEYSRINRKNQQ